MTRYTDSRGTPSCPGSLPEAWRSIWTEVVGSVGDDHWRASDASLLEAFVTSLARLRWAQGAIAEHGEVDADGSRSQASRIAESCAKVVGQLAPKLRLCPSSRTDSREAGRTTSGGRHLDAYKRTLDSLRDGHPWESE